MTNRPEIVFAPLSADLEPTVVVLAGEDVALGGRARETRSARGRRARQGGRGGAVQGTQEVDGRGARAAAHRQRQPRWSLLGTGKPARPQGERLGAARRLGGRSDLVRARPSRRASSPRLPTTAGITPGDDRRAARVRRRAAPLRVPQVPDEEEAGRGRTPSPTACRSSSSTAPIPTRRAPRSRATCAVANGIVIARDLVNEPANALGPVEFAERVQGAGEGRRRGRDPRCRGDRRAEDGRAARRRAGQRAPGARRRHAVARRQVEARQAALPSSARAWCSTPAASPSSRRPAWRT